MDVWANVIILLMYGSHDMRHKVFRGLTGCQRTPGDRGVTKEEKKGESSKKATSADRKYRWVSEE